MLKKKNQGDLEAQRHGFERSSEWPKVEKAYKKAHPTCAACTPDATKHAIQVHHKFPFHLVVAVGRGDLELDSRNLISLCETTHKLPAQNHHLLLGHLDDFKSYNADVLNDAAVKFHGMTQDEIKSNKDWLEKKKEKPLDELTDEEKENLRKTLDSLFPNHS